MLALAGALGLGLAAQQPGGARQTPDEPVSPFRAMREAGAAIEVQVDDDTWYRLENLNGIAAGDLVAFARKEFGTRWWKRITEDLVMVLVLMGKEPRLTADLVLRAGDAKTPTTCTDVPMTAAKRRALWEANKPADREDHRAPALLDDAAVAADLAELSHLLDERFAYRHRRPVDAKVLLAAAKQRLGRDPVPAQRFAVEIAAAVRRFKPEWQPPAGAFSDWHFLVLQRDDNAKAWHYDQPVVVLLDEGCFSATDIFLGAFAGWPNVTLLGTPSSGGSARAETFALPRSRLAVRLASMASFRPAGKLYDGNGIAPDVVVEREPGDLVGATDAQLAAALARLR